MIRGGDADGAVAMILAGEERAKEITDTPVWIKGLGTAYDAHYLGDRDLSECMALRKAAQRAYKMAGIDNPRDQIDLIELSEEFSFWTSSSWAIFGWRMDKQKPRQYTVEIEEVGKPKLDLNAGRWETPIKIKIIEHKWSGWYRGKRTSFYEEIKHKAEEGILKFTGEDLETFHKDFSKGLFNFSSNIVVAVSFKPNKSSKYAFRINVNASSCNFSSKSNNAGS